MGVDLNYEEALGWLRTTNDMKYLCGSVRILPCSDRHCMILQPLQTMELPTMNLPIPYEIGSRDCAESSLADRGGFIVRAELPGRFRFT